MRSNGDRNRQTLQPKMMQVLLQDVMATVHEAAQPNAVTAAAKRVLQGAALGALRPSSSNTAGSRTSEAGLSFFSEMFLDNEDHQIVAMQSVDLFGFLHI